MQSLLFAIRPRVPGSQPRPGSIIALTDPKHAATARISRHGGEGISFYEGEAVVKPQAADLVFTSFPVFSFLQALYALVGPVHL